MAEDDDCLWLDINGNTLTIPYLLVKKFKAIDKMVEDGLGFEPSKPIYLKGPNLALQHFVIINQYWHTFSQPETDKDREVLSLLTHVNFIEAKDRSNLILFVEATKRWNHPIAPLLDKELRSRSPGKSAGPLIWLSGMREETFFLNQDMVCGFTNIMCEIEKGKGSKRLDPISIKEADLSKEEIVEIFVASRGYNLLELKKDRKRLVQEMYANVGDNVLKRIKHSTLLLGHPIYTPLDTGY